MRKVDYSLVQLPNGVFSVRSLLHGETFHPVIGPVAEAEALYLRQLRLAERFRQETADVSAGSEFVIWDVGLGAAANALTVIRALRPVPGTLRMISFDATSAPLEFAYEQSQSLSYFKGCEKFVEELIARHESWIIDEQTTIRWNLHLGDFPELIRSDRSLALPKPHAILFDAFSPAKNPEMWTLPLFSTLFQRLDPARPCAMPTYSRSTMLRVSLLLAGFFVGSGHPTGEKEETTIAANAVSLIDEPLDLAWLDRARRSRSAEPLWTPHYRQAPLTAETWERLRSHPQFRKP